MLTVIWLSILSKNPIFTTNCNVSYFSSWATVCKTVCPMLSDHCPVLSCLSVLSVTLVYCGQMVGWIKMKLGIQVGLGPGHIVWDGDPAPLPKGAQPLPQFLAHICCGQMAGWIKMPFGMAVHVGPDRIVLDGNPGPPHKGHSSPLNFGQCLLWPNGWMDQNATWYWGRPQRRRHCVTRWWCNFD